MSRRARSSLKEFVAGLGAEFSEIPGGGSGDGHPVYKTAERLGVKIQVRRGKARLRPQPEGRR